jgi:hypothetical protein
MTRTRPLTHNVTPTPSSLQGLFTQYVRANNISDEVEAAVVRKARKTALKRKKANAQAKQMAAVDVALQTSLAETPHALAEEIASFESSKTALRTYLQDQYRSRLLLHNGMYNTIPTSSEFRSTAKPYKLRMKPQGNNTTTDEQIGYLQRLLHVMIAEDLQRALKRTVGFENTNLVRRLPVICEAYLNPMAIHFKKLQEEKIKEIAKPKDNPWYERLHREYMGKILFDRGCYRVIAIQYVPNKGRNVFPCWEATTEPVSKNANGEYVVPSKHLVATSVGSKKLLKSAEVGFALAEYSNGDEVDPVRLPFADQCLAKHLEREARLASKSAPAQEARQALQSHSGRKRREPHASALPTPTPIRSSRRQRVSGKEGDQN